MPMRLSCIGIAVTVLACATSAQAQRATSIAADPLDLLPKPAFPEQPAPAPQLDLKTPDGAAAGRLDQRLTPARFDIEGVNALPFAELAGLFAPLAGQPVTVGQLAAVAREASAKYKDAGY